MTQTFDFVYNEYAIVGRVKTKERLYRGTIRIIDEIEVQHLCYGGMKFPVPDTPTTREVVKFLLYEIYQTKAKGDIHKAGSVTGFNRKKPGHLKAL